MRVMAVDPGSVRMGYGVIKAEGELLSYVECGVISASAGRDKYQRLAEIGGELATVISEFRPDVLAMEAGFVAMVRGKMQQGALVSAAARGVAGFIAARCGLRVVEYAPSAVKKSVTGAGNADKATVAKMVKLTLGLQKEPEPDAADALAVAIHHARAFVAEVRAARAGAAA